MATEMAQTDPEGIDGIHMTWNAWPRTKVEASKCVIPIAASISPIRPHPDIPTLPYAPLRCKTCTAVLNPFARVDFAALIWICPLCFQRNHLPRHYSGISETNVPGELYPQYTTIQYSLAPPDSNPLSPLVYIFVLDTCMIEEELGYAKSALQQAIGLLNTTSRSNNTQIRMRNSRSPDYEKMSRTSSMSSDSPKIHRNTSSARGSTRFDGNHVKIPKPKWYFMMFGNVRFLSEMDLQDIKIRQVRRTPSATFFPSVEVVKKVSVNRKSSWRVLNVLSCRDDASVHVKTSLARMPRV